MNHPAPIDYAARDVWALSQHLRWLELVDMGQFSPMDLRELEAVQDRLAVLIQRLQKAKAA